MLFSYKEKVNFKYLRIKYRYGVTRIVNDYPEYEWSVNGVKKLLKKIDDTGSDSGRSKSALTEENIEQVKEMILSQEDQRGTHSTQAEIAREHNIDRRSVSRIIAQDLDIGPLRKRKVQKLTDSNIKNPMILSKKLLSKYTQKTLKLQLCNSYNDVVYVPKKMRKVEVPEERLLYKTEASAKQIMVSAVILKAGETLIFLLNQIQRKKQSITVMRYLRNKMIS